MRIVSLSLTLALMTLLSSGCASKYFDHRATLDRDHLGAPGDGVVVARIIKTTANNLPFDTLILTPENYQASKNIKLIEISARKSYTPNTTVFAAPIPAGNYSLRSIYYFYSNDRYYWSESIPATANFGTFSVKPGKVTDLGNLIYYHKPDGEKYFKLLARAENQNPGEVLKKYYPFYQYKTEAVNTWNEDGFGEDRQSRFISMVQNPTFYNKIYRAPNNDLYFLGKLGAIIIRRRSGEWDIDAVDTNLDLNAIIRTKRGDLLTGGVEGRLFWKKNGSDWEDISLDHHYVIHELIESGNDRVDVLASKGDKLMVFRGNITGSKPSWSKLTTYHARYYDWERAATKTKEDKKKKKRRRSGTKPQIITGARMSRFMGKDVLVIVTRSRRSPVISSAKLRYYQIKRKSWQAKEYDFPGRISAIVEAGAASIGIEEPSFFSFSDKSSFKRFDKKSRSWKKMGDTLLSCSGTPSARKTCKDEYKTYPARRTRFDFMRIPWFKNELNALAIARYPNSGSTSEEDANKLTIIKTKDGGKTWIDTGNKLPRPYCISVVSESKDSFLISCSGATGDFFESKDEGKTWTHVRQHEDF